MMIRQQNQNHVTASVLPTNEKGHLTASMRPMNGKDHMTVSEWPTNKKNVLSWLNSLYCFFDNISQWARVYLLYVYMYLLQTF